MNFEQAANKWEMNSIWIIETSWQNMRYFAENGISPEIAFRDKHDTGSFGDTGHWNSRYSFKHNKQYPVCPHCNKKIKH